MRPILPRSVCALFASLAGVASLPAATVPVTVEGRLFQIEEGFTLERVAGPDLAPRPVSASVDDRGRLFVTDSSGSNLPPADQLKDPTHRILCLEDSNGDGRYDRSTVFADRVMFPQGCLWHDGWVYVAAPPSIWRFRDTNGDGSADQREEWFKGGTLTGCANDIHGPHLGPDGYLYWTKGAFAEQHHDRPGRRPIHDRAAHILRARPDGSDLDVVMSGGMDNPVEVAFTPDGEPLFTSTFIDFTQPGRRDGVGHAIYGGVFGKENSVLDDRNVIRTSPDLLHPFIQLGAAAPSGFCRYQSAAFGPAHRDNLFVSTFNLHRISRHVLRPDGSTYASSDSDFVVSEDADFHPTDVLEDADGSLLIIDTGGWYKLCCPTSQLAKPDVLGGIYRVKRVGARHTSDSSSRRRLVAPPSATGLVWKLKQAALARDSKRASDFRIPLRNFLTKNAPPDALLRIAIEGLGRIGDKPSIPSLLDAAVKVSEPQLEHAILFALVEINDATPLRAALATGPAPRRRAALIALDQFPGNNLSPEDVLPLLAEGDTRLWQAAQWIVSRHPEWSTSMVGWFRDQVDHPAHRGTAAQQFRFLTPSTEGRQLLGEIIHRPSLGPTTRRAALTVMASVSPKDAPDSWKPLVSDCLREADSDFIRATVPVARLVSTDPDVQSALLRISRSSVHPSDLRLAALAAMPNGWNVDADAFKLLVESGPSRVAAETLARASLSDPQRLALTAAVQSAAPMPLLALLPIYQPGGDASLGSSLVDALRSAHSKSSLRPELVRSILARFPDDVRQAGESIVLELNSDSTRQSAHLDQLLAELKSFSTDIRRGQAVFMDAKAACYTCHRIGYLGGKVGPDLTRIGEARTERDLLESIVYPNASFVRSYEPVLLTTRDGSEINGVLQSESDREFVVVSGPGSEQRIPRGDVTDQRPGSVSLMPAGLDSQISRQELADLLAFLKNTRWGAR
jgi:putative membrane-bound dehydrogenase-like protein